MVRQMGDWPAQRGMDRTIPQIRFAATIDPIQLPVGLRSIIAQEAVHLKAKVEARAATYANWYRTRMVERTLGDIARELSLPLEAIATTWAWDGTMT